MAKQNETKKKTTNLTVENIAKKIVEKQKESSVEITGDLIVHEQTNTAKIIVATPQKTILEEKLDEIIYLLKKIVVPDNSKLSNMSLTDLAALKETLNHEISSNRYPGGDSNIIIRGQNLILKINAEITSRINQYN